MSLLHLAVTHDVKNQLAEIAQRLHRRGDADAEMQMVMDASRRLSEMLLLQRADAEQLWAHVDAVNPADFLDELAAEYAELFLKIAVSVEVTRAPDCAFFDRALVRMALGNALHNACRHAASRVSLAAYEQDGMLVFKISDDGPGFTAGMLTSAGERPSPASVSGTGLGLYLARKIAELHRLDARSGHIALQNANGGQFLMVLP